MFKNLGKKLSIVQRTLSEAASTIVDKLTGKKKSSPKSQKTSEKRSDVKENLES